MKTPLYQIIMAIRKCILLVLLFRATIYRHYMLMLLMSVCVCALHIKFSSHQCLNKMHCAHCNWAQTHSTQQGMTLRDKNSLAIKYIFVISSLFSRAYPHWHKRRNKKKMRMGKLFSRRKHFAFGPMFINHLLYSKRKKVKLARDHWISYNGGNVICFHLICYTISSESQVDYIPLYTINKTNCVRRRNIYNICGLSLDSVSYEIDWIPISNFDLMGIRIEEWFMVKLSLRSRAACWSNFERIFYYTQINHSIYSIIYITRMQVVAAVRTELVFFLLILIIFRNMETF